MGTINLADYQPVFYPKSIAVVGASNANIGFGSGFLRTNMAFGFKGQMYPVNPKGGEIQGLKAYPSVLDIPDPVDFAVIAIPSHLVLAAVKDCVKKGIKGAEILSSGFKEAGPEGLALEKEVVRVAREGGLKLIGPNCFGLHSPESGVTLMPGWDFSSIPGPVGLISQSGVGACDLVYSAQGRGLGFSVVMSYGNACDIDAVAMMDYFEADPKTKIVGAYLEGVENGRAFFESLKRCAAKKPVVIMKGGLSEQGHRGTVGHTGSMAGTRHVWQAAIKSAGAMAAHDLRDLVECLMAVNCLEGFTGGGVGLMAGGGARVVEGLDAASNFGFPVPELDDASTAKIQALLPPAGGKGGNPADLANPGIVPGVINPTMEVFSAREDIQIMVMYQMLFYFYNNMRKMSANPEDAMAPHQEILTKAKEIREKTGKPLALVLVDTASSPAHGEVEQYRMKVRHFYTTNGIPCFDTGNQAFSVMRRVAEYYKRRQG
ncbi:MAG: CoA-binding protein [Proteobacteria bacterium]|nr:CoA-binding protein [Pseudomonadota bacterium]MBU4471613.1 CoA-binding protein [Pseudomonadota bacterium]MCG2751095.1 CoA-binding protein [Desulfobacteraceae bacterium]